MVTILNENTAVTFWAPFIWTVQVPVPVHAPDQPVKTEPAAGEAVKASEAPEARVAWQVAPQEIPVPVTVPDPVPDLLRVRR